MRNMQILLEDKEFKKLENLKEEKAILDGKSISWREFILKKFNIK